MLTEDEIGEMEAIPLVTPREPSEDERVLRKHLNKLWITHKSQLRTKRLCHCLADPLYRICRDVHMSTRSQWDTRNRAHIYYDKIEEFDGGIVVRDSKHITWSRFSVEHQSYTIIHYTVVPDGEYDHCSVYWIKQLDDGTQCHVETNQSLDDLMYLERIVVEHGDYMDNIYQDWSCTSCKEVVSCTSLHCTRCFTPKYWKCTNSECDAPQLQDDNACYKCKTKKEV